MSAHADAGEHTRPNVGGTIVDAYSMTASGKIQKYKLRDMAKEQLGIDLEVFAGETDA